MIEDYVDHAHVSLLLLSISMKADVVPSLTEYNKQLIDAYLSIPYVETKCGYMACLDQYASLLSHSDRAN